MPKKLIFLTSFVLTMALATVTRADWAAYNDLSDGNGGTAALGMNVTTHTYLDTDKALIDFNTGATLPVTITMEVVGDGDANGDVYPNNGGNCGAGTDADDIFGGILDLTGGNELDSTDEHKAIIFNGLNPGMSYTITLTSNRDNSSYTNRWTRVTIEGADAYIYAASAGVEKLSEASGEFCTGHNTVNGYVMKWTNVSCGADGSFSVKSENADRGAKGYAMMAFKLEEFALGSGLGNAYNPIPADGVLYEDTWVILSWSAGRNAVSHDVYLGENFDNVNNGSADTFRGNQTETTLYVGFPGYPYPDGLVPGTTYYWRIDEVNDADPNSPLKGKIWSFSIPPKTAYNPNPADGAEFVDLDVTLSWTPGFGAKLHTVYFGEDYDEVNNATGGVSTGTATYSPGTLEAEKVYYWRVDEFDPPTTYKGDIWSFTTPGAVGNPQPANRTTDVQMVAKLSWTPATNAVSHDVYFGTDKAAVRTATKASPEYKGSKALGDETLDPGKLAWHSDYYWRVDAAYNTGTVKGLVWSFTTADFLLVDDFESYNDIDPPDPASNRIFDKWKDGFETPTTNGALVGYDMPPYAERTTVHTGTQSMPYRYDNANKTSEATLTLVYPRDWTEEGVAKLSLWFRGAASNSAEKMYVALNGGTPVYHDDSVVTKKGGWNQWVIDLQAFQGVNLTNVNTLTIGVGTKGSPTAGGSGKMYFDDIRLNRL